MILCVGEILADMLGRGDTYEMKAGGAPFNVACGLAKLGVSAGFVGCVGKDLPGDFLAAYAEKQGFARLDLYRSEKNTTLAFVRSTGEDRAFSFYRADTADGDFPSMPEGILENVTLVHFGSLPFSAPKGRVFCTALAEKARQKGIPVAFDVNYREGVFDENGWNALKEFAYAADDLKLSEEEWALLNGAPFPCGDLRARRLTAVTMGKRGAAYSLGKEFDFVPSYCVPSVDATGAGDAFWAGVLSRLHGIGAAKLSARTAEMCIRFGAACGALATTAIGATEAFPSAAAAEKLMRREPV